MHNRIVRSLKRKVRLGRAAIPAWTIALAAMLVAAVAGQAVGPVLAGAVTGSAVVKVGQTVVLTKIDDAGAWVDNPIDAATLAIDVKMQGVDYGVAFTPDDADDFAGTASDEGTLFNVALQTQVGQRSVIGLLLDNLSGKPANAVLEITAPVGIDVSVDEAKNAVNVVQGQVPYLARLSSTTWLFTLEADALNDDVDIFIAVEPKDNVAPGFYTISGAIHQVIN